MSNSSDVKTILHQPNEVNKEQEMRGLIDDILGDIRQDDLLKTLDNVSKTTKEEGINASYEGNRLANNSISKLLADIDVNTDVKEEIVMNVQSLKIDNLYEHYLLQSRLCGVPIDVFLSTETEDIQQGRQNTSIEDTMNLVTRVEVGETYNDYSKNFKGLDIEQNELQEDVEEDDVLINFDEEQSDPQEHDKQDHDLEDTTVLFDIPQDIEPQAQEQELQDIEPQLQEQELQDIEPQSQESQDHDLEDTTILFDIHENEQDKEVQEEFIDEPITFTDEIQEDIKPMQEPITFTEEVVEETPTEKIILGEEMSNKNETPEVPFQLQDDITRLMQDIDLNINPVQPIGSGISKTYSLEELKSVTGGSSEI